MVLVLKMGHTGGRWHIFFNVPKAMYGNVVAAVKTEKILSLKCKILRGVVNRGTFSALFCSPS